MADRSAKPDTWMPLFIGDYISDTTHLSTLQHGAYLLLLMSCWKWEGKLPNDDQQLAAITRLSPAVWRNNAAVLRKLFQVEGDVLVQKRLVTEYAHAKKVHAAQVQNGSKGGRPSNASKANVLRGTKPKDNPRVISGLTQSEAKSNPSESPSQSHIQIKEKDIVVSGDTTAIDPFEIFWENRARRAGGDDKQKALNAWNARLREGHAPGEIQAGMDRYRAYCDATEKTGTEYVKQTSTFLGKGLAFKEAWVIPTPPPPKPGQGGADTEQAWQELRSALRAGKFPADPITAEAGRRIGGSRLHEIESREIDKRRGAFDEAYRSLKGTASDSIRDFALTLVKKVA